MSVGWVNGQTQGVLLITEWNANPSAVADSEGEYIELYNTTSSSIDIDGWILKDDGTDSHTISSTNGTTVVPAYDFLVLGLGDGTYNSRDYQYSSYTLGNSGDEIVLLAGAVEICRVNYSNGDPFGAGIACELNDVANHTNGVTLFSDYIAATATLMGTDKGSPGVAGNTLGTGAPADTDPPVWTSSYPKTANVESTTLDVVANMDEEGIAYYVVLTDGATAPTSAEVKAGTGSGGAGVEASGNIIVTAATTDFSDNVTGLTASTAYDIYVVAEDDETSPNLQASPELVEVTTAAADVTPPSWEATYPKTANIANTDLDLLVSIDEKGTVYYVVLADGSTAPNSAQVIAGTDGVGGAAVVAGNISITAASTEFSDNISGLSAGTTYDIFVVAADDEAPTPNVQAAPRELADVTTTSTDPEPSEHASGLALVLDSPNELTLNWADAAGIQLPAAYLILANETGTFTDPVDGTAQADDTDLSDGSSVVNVAFGVETYQWTGLTENTTYYFKMYSYTNSGTVIDYKIDGTPPEINGTTPYVSITYPVGSEKFYAGDEINITWNSANVTTVDIQVYVPNEAVWDTIIPNTPSDGAELFTIPADAPYSDQYKLAIVDSANSSVTDTSSGVFTVISTPTIYDIQSDNDGDLSNYDGHIVKTSGIITFSATGEYVIQDGTGSWNGIYVYDYGFDNTSVEGDNVTIEAEVGNYNGVTQLKNVVDLTVNSSGNPLPAITTLTTAGLTEEYEGVLVKVVNAQVTSIANIGDGYFEINDGSGALAVDDNLYYDTEIGITNGRDLTITGIGHYNNEFQLLPRYASDIVSATDTVGSTEYAIDQGTLAITDIPFSTTLAVFEANFTAADTATFDVFDADGTTPATVLDDTKLLIVTAADGITEATYTITRNAALTDATVTSSVYTVDDGAGTITDIPNGTDLATFKGNITAPPYGSFEVFESDGSTTATDLATGYILTGTAEDSSTKDYTITVSDIIPDEDSNTGEPTAQIATATIVVVDGDEDTEAFEVFSFDINDEGTADGIVTNVSQIVLFYGPNMTIDFETEIDSGYFEVNGTPVDLDGEPVFGADSVAFPILDSEISVSDGGSVNVVLKLILEPTVADGKVIQFFIDADQHGFETIGISSEFAPAFAADVVGNNITINVAATELNFSTEPTNVYVDDMITPAVVVEAIDANGNIDTDYVTDIAITATGATLVGTPSETPTAGVATFNALSFSNEGTGVTLTAASGTLTNAVSATFDVTTEPEKDLFFSEYIEGGSYNKALEIYNGTGTDVDLSDYVIRVSNGGDPWEEVFVFPEFTLSNGDVYVLAHEDAVADILAEADSVVLDPYGGGTTAVANFNGNDARALCKVVGTDTTIIDIIGDITGDPGDGWDVAGTTNATKDHTLIRKLSIIIGNDDWTASAGTDIDDSEWVINDKDYFDDLGSHSTSLSSEAEILTFVLAEQTEPATIGTNTVDITVLSGTDASALTPTITVSDGAEISPVSGLEQDFTNPVVYTVTAEDESTKEWTVTVTVSATASTEADITEITVAGADSTKINSVDTTIVIYAPYGFDVTAVQPDFVISAGATITDTTSAHDFTSPVTYIVTAQDAITTKNWEVTISVETSTDVANIAALRALYSETNENIYKITGDVTFTFATAPYFYIQDATAAILIYDHVTYGVITSSYDIGDNVTDLVGTFDTFGGNMQFKLKEDPGTAISTGNEVTAQVVTIPELAGNYANYDAELIKLEDVTFTETTGTFVYQNNYTLNNGSDQVALRTNFESADYIGTNIPTETLDVTAIAGIYDLTVQVYPRLLTDFVIVTGINNPDGIVSMNIYPNPSNGNFTLEMNASKAGTFNVEIINIQGQVVFTKEINQDGFYKETIDISDNASGIYYIRINDGKNLKVSKIIIQ